MRRFIVTAEHWSAGQIELSADVTRHLGTVLRLSVGDELLLLDGEGLVAQCRLEVLGKKVGSAQILRQWTEEETGLPVQLLQGIPKGEKMDWLLQKTTELGVQCLTPVKTERSIPDLKKDRAAKRLQRWRRIGQEAARQCRRSRLPTIEAVQPLSAALQDCGAELKLILWEEESRALRQELPLEPPGSVAVLVGPEGGLSPAEAEMAIEAGFLPVRMGPRILRTETAGVAILSILQYVYGDLGAGIESQAPICNRSDDGKEQE